MSMQWCGQRRLINESCISTGPKWPSVLTGSLQRLWNKDFYLSSFFKCVTYLILVFLLVTVLTPLVTVCTLNCPTFHSRQFNCWWWKFKRKRQQALYLLNKWVSTNWMTRSSQMKEDYLVIEINSELLINWSDEVRCAAFASTQIGKS